MAMRRGTRVGRAVVEVIADGSGINEEIVNSVDEAGPGVEKAGDEHGERYGDHFSEGFFRRLRNKFSKDIADRLDDSVAKAGSDAGGHLGDSISKSLLDRIDALGPEASTRVRKLMADVEKASLAAERALQRVENDNGKSPTRLANLTHAARTAENAAARLERQLRATFRAENLLDVAVSRNRGKGNEITRIGDRVGSLFGAGSRNNFLNVFGKSMGGIVNVIETATFGARDMFSTFRKGFSEASEGASFFEKIMGGLSGGGGEAGGGIAKAFGSIAASGPAAAVAIAAVVAGMAIMVTVASALLAILTALLATITSGLVGGLLVLGGAFAAGAAAAGLLVAAFTSLTDAQSKMLKSAFLPLKEEFTGLGQLMLKDLVPAFSTWSANLQRALLLAAPVAKVMGKAFADAGNALTASFSGRGFQMFSQALTTFLPSIVTRLSSALGSFLNGLLGLFSALLPSVNQFAGYLVQVAERFAAWATSAKGQNAIRDFVDRALVSLQSLWNFVVAVGALINKLLFSPEAQQAGNSIFDSMTQGIKNFLSYISEPGRLQRWFDEGKSLADSLGKAIRAVAIAIGALNSSGILSGIASIAGFVERAATAFQKLPAPIRASLIPFKALEIAAKVMAATVVSVVALIIDDIGLMLRGLAKSLALIAGIPKVGDAFKGVARKVAAAADNVQALGARMDKIPKQLLISIGANTEPAIESTIAFVNQVKGYHINIPVTISTNATVAEASALSSGHPSVSSSSGTSLSGLVSSGTTALNNTSTSSGGFKQPKQWHNPYKKWAESLIKDGPSVSAQIKNAMLSLNKQAASAIRSAAKAAGSGDVQSAMDSLLSTLMTTGEQSVNTARSALNSAATDLANATSKGAAKKALAQVKKAQKDLAAAIANQKRVNAAAKILNAQKVVTGSNVTALLNGLKVTNATLADYAEARSRVADMLNDANQKLTEAIRLRDDYKNQVSDSIKAFGSLLTAQAQTINGVEQALTATDITSNLQSRLDKIKKFQDDLRLLLAQGLSNDAYKQIVDAGVEQGTQIADALLAGGVGAIQTTNSLVSQINGIADTLGSETSSRLYQAGVDAAQGLVDGLTSLSAQLDSAAYRLGTSIATAIKNALGIHSPSRVLYNMMDYVGDGAAQGLDNQHVKVGSAAARLAERIAVSPEAMYSSSRSATAVSGNQPGWVWTGDIVTPTTDPHAVAMEVLNEVTGRL